MDKKLEKGKELAYTLVNPYPTQKTIDLVFSLTNSFLASVQVNIIQNSHDPYKETYI